jgi:hypothetical protein
LIGFCILNRKDRKNREEKMSAHDEYILVENNTKDSLRGLRGLRGSVFNAANKSIIRVLGAYPGLTRLSNGSSLSYVPLPVWFFDCSLIDILLGYIMYLRH